MFLKFGDKIKLLPSWNFDSSKAAPVWGGPFGYHVGEITKIHTHDHDKAKHVAVVKWDNGEEASFPERALAIATKEEVEVAYDDKTCIGPIEKDLYVLVKTSRGNFALNTIETLPFGYKDASCRYVSGSTRMVLPTLENSDYNLIAAMASTKDYSEVRTSHLFTAAQHIANRWGLPDFRTLPLPVPAYDTVRQAAASAPAGPGILFFHLPFSVMQYADGDSHT